MTLAAVIAAHVAVLLLLLRSRQPEIVRPRTAGYTLVAASISASAPSQPPAPPPAMPRARTGPRHTPSVPVIPAVTAAALTVPNPATACSPQDSITAALAADPLVEPAVSAAPDAARSVSEAITMWEAGWSDVAASPQAPLGVVRAAVERALTALPGDCLAAPIIGPRLIALRTRRGTSFLVFGSGRWKWAQLIAPDNGVAWSD